MFPFYGLLSHKTAAAEDYQNYLYSFYSVIKVMLNAIPDSFTAQLGFPFIYLHIIFIFVVVMVLMNMMLSVMTEHMEHLAHFVGTYRTLQLVDAHLLMEERIGWLCRNILARCRWPWLLIYVEEELLNERNGESLSLAGRKCFEIEESKSPEKLEFF
jgi:hypothetical protein